MVDDEDKALKEPFWIFEPGESRVIDSIFRRRFPETYTVLARSLELADPLDIVYPGNPNEYSDVVQEIIVLLAPVNGSLDVLSIAEVEQLVREGLARCFGELPDPERVRKAAKLIVAP